MTGSLAWFAAAPFVRALYLRRAPHFGVTFASFLISAELCRIAPDSQWPCFPVRKLDKSMSRLFEALLFRLFPSLLKIGPGLLSRLLLKHIGCLGEGLLVSLCFCPHWLCTFITSIVFSLQHFNSLTLVLDRGRYVSLSAPSGSHGGESSLCRAIPFVHVA